MLMHTGQACDKKSGALWEGIGAVTKDLCNQNLSTKIEHHLNSVSSNHTSSLEPLPMKPQTINWNPCKSSLIGLLSDREHHFALNKHFQGTFANLYELLFQLFR